MNHAVQTVPSPIPLTILTGFLGAGKTTLLNQILRGEHGLRVAVLVNDFGAINIDAALIDHVRDATISLRNGCICCSIRSDLLAAVLGLLRREQPPEYIIIECSGVADPIEVARTFNLPELRPWVQLDSMIALIDAEQVHTHEEYQDLIADQIAAADIVILNKIDLASANLRNGLRAWVGAIAPAARVIEASYGHVALELLLGVGRYAHTLAHHSADRQHGDMFATWSFTTERPFAFKPLRAMLANLPTTIIRAKGTLWVAEQPDRRLVLQLVGQRLSLSVDTLWSGAPRRSDLVLIGAVGNIDPVQLDAAFRSATTDF